MTLADPIYEIEVKCPVCYTEDFWSYRLKSKCQSVSYDELTIPHYTGLKGYEDADFLAIAATVCPRCLYSSTQPDSFTRLGGMLRSDPVILSDGLQERLLMASPERQALLASWDLSVDDFDRPRSPKATYVSYLLTGMSAAVKAEFRFSRANAEAAAAYLYGAESAKSLGPDEYRRAIERAAKAFSQVFETCDHDPDQTEDIIYLCVALYLHLGWREHVRPFLNAIDRLERKARHQDTNEALKIRRTYDRIRDIWLSAGGSHEWPVDPEV